MDEVLQLTAHAMALRGTCPTARVGAVFALDGRILATGYNGAPAGLPHCDHPAAPAPVELPAIAAPRPQHATAAGNAAPTCAVAVHAEANGLAFAARYGVPLGGSTIYCTLSPCSACARLLVNAGVARFVATAMYRDHAGVHVLRSAGVRFDWLPLAGHLLGRVEADAAHPSIWRPA